MSSFTWLKYHYWTVPKDSVQCSDMHNKFSNFTWIFYENWYVYCYIHINMGLRKLTIGNNWKETLSWQTVWWLLSQQFNLLCHFSMLWVRNPYQCYYFNKASCSGSKARHSLSSIKQQTCYTRVGIDSCLTQLGVQYKARHSLSSIKHQAYYMRVKIDEHLTETIDNQRKYKLFQVLISKFFLSCANIFFLLCWFFYLNMPFEWPSM